MLVVWTAALEGKTALVVVVELEDQSVGDGHEPTGYTHTLCATPPCAQQQGQQFEMNEGRFDEGTERASRSPSCASTCSESCSAAQGSTGHVRSTTALHTTEHLLLLT